MIDHQLASRIHHIESKIGHRHRPHQLITYLFASEASLEHAERAGATLTRRTLVGIAPGDNLAVEDHVIETGERVFELGKGFGDFVASSRENFYLSTRTVGLRADPVILVFHAPVLKVAQRLLCRSGGTG